MNDIVVFKAADHVNDSRHFANVTEELVAQSFSFGGAFDQSGNIAEFYGRIDGSLGVVNFVKFFYPFVRYRDNAHIWFDRAERVISRFSAGFGYCVE